MWCARSLGIGPGGIKASIDSFDKDDLSRQSLDGHDKHGRDASLWSSWQNSRREYDEQCYLKAKELSWAQGRWFESSRPGH